MLDGFPVFVHGKGTQVLKEWRGHSFRRIPSKEFVNPPLVLGCFLPPGEGCRVDEIEGLHYVFFLWVRVRRKECECA